MKIIKTQLAPAAIGPYSQAINVGDFLFISGQLPVDSSTGNVVEADIKAQTQQSLTNLVAILKEANYDVHHVVKTTVYLSKMDNFQKMNEVYAQFFTKNFPARCAIEVSRLPKDVLVEIDAIAFKQ
jgi:2-iminobutanoate/2-iminopropanoate deaminase